MAASKVNVDTTAEEITDLPRIDEAIASVERLYQALTGSQAPPVAEEPDVPIPVEKDAAEFMTERLDRLIDALGQSLGQPGAEGAPPSPSATETPWSPPITVWESADGLMVLLEVPGVSREDLQLSDEGDSLTVKGHRKLDHDGMRLRMTERPLGPFRRRIILPRGAGGGDLQAKLREGVLEIRIPRPRKPAAGQRTIPIS